MKNHNTTLQLIVRSALLLAIAVLFQGLRFSLKPEILSTILVGSLVNLTLFVAAGTVGWRGGIAVAVLTPVVAFLQGHLALPVLIPFVAIGNLVLVLLFEGIERGVGTQSRLWVGVIGAAGVKAIVLYVLMVVLFVGVILPAMGLPAQKVGAMTTSLSLNFSWPQLVTAIIGGAAAIPVLQGLRRALKMQKSN